jgi:threonine aldolase
MFGGGMRQVGIIAAAGLHALDHHLERLKEDHENAKRLAVGLKELRGVSIHPEQVETNIVLFDVADSGKTSFEIRDFLKEKNILIHAVDKTHIRLVTHLDVNREDIETTLVAFGTVLRKG